MVTAGCRQPPADTLLIRSDGYIAWTAGSGEPADELRSGLRRALTTWFGAEKPG